MKTYPIFRLAIFLAAGILFADTFRIGVGLGLVASLLLMLLFLYFLLKKHSYVIRWLFGAVLSLFMFLVGAILTGYASEAVKVDWPLERKVYRAVVQEPLQEKRRSYQVSVEVAEKEVLLYFPKDSLSASLMPGDELYVYTRIEKPENREENQTFDYARYLYYKGISGTAYVPSGAWRKMDARPSESLKIKALLFRERILGKYRQWGVSPEAFPVLSALTLGYKNHLDEETRDAYSVAGISHVLALSGMHIGIIWFLLNFLLQPLVRMRLDWLKGILVVAVLWAFAFVVGLEASVVRAVVMCMLMEVGRLSGFRSFSLNTLAIAAFFMLLYRPFYLFDVGFQLSFVAVASILAFYPLFYESIPVKNRLVKWTWGVMSVSLAAQLGAAPLVMYYFSSFSVYFLLTNLVVAVVVPFVIYGAFLMVFTACWPVLQGYVVKLLNGLVVSLNSMADWTATLPYATFSIEVLKPVEIVLFYALLGAWLMYGRSKKRQWLIGGLALCACLLGTHLFLLWSQKG